MRFLRFLGILVFALLPLARSIGAEEAPATRSLGAAIVAYGKDAKAPDRIVIYQWFGSVVPTDTEELMHNMADALKFAAGEDVRVLELVAGESSRKALVSVPARLGKSAGRTVPATLAQIRITTAPDGKTILRVNKVTPKQTESAEVTPTAKISGAPTATAKSTPAKTAPPAAAAKSTLTPAPKKVASGGIQSSSADMSQFTAKAPVRERPKNIAAGHVFLGTLSLNFGMNGDSSAPVFHLFELYGEPGLTMDRSKHDALALTFAASIKINYYRLIGNDWYPGLTGPEAELEIRKITTIHNAANRDWVHGSYYQKGARDLN